jgi:hypothetical protein
MPVGLQQFSALAASIDESPLYEPRREAVKLREPCRCRSGSTAKGAGSSMEIAVLVTRQLVSIYSQEAFPRHCSRGSR